jgi:hypothetical protein
MTKVYRRQCKEWLDGKRIEMPLDKRPRCHCGSETTLVRGLPKEQAVA